MKATSTALALVLLSTVAAHAETPPPGGSAPAPALAPASDLPRLYVGASLGYNSPAGIAGVEADYRIARHLSAGLASGYGLWGLRISPTVKLELPLNPAVGVFLEGALAINTGGSGHSEENGMREEFQLGVVPAASISLGGRARRWGSFWTGGKVGYNFALRSKDSAYDVMGGGLGSQLTREVLDLAYPGGFLVSWMAGAAF
jgi:hypothetical protein